MNKLDISNFDPKAPPPQTPAFWDIVHANSAPEDAELADVLDAIGKEQKSANGRPDAITLLALIAAAAGEASEWLMDRRNRRAIPHRMERCGYVPVRHPTRKDGLWRLGGHRQVIYARAALSEEERLRAAQHFEETDPAVKQ